MDTSRIEVGDQIEVVDIMVAFPCPGPIQPIPGDRGVVVELGKSPSIVRVEFEGKPYGHSAFTSWPFCMDEIRKIDEGAELWSELELQ